MTRPDLPPTGVGVPSSRVIPPNIWVELNVQVDSDVEFARVAMLWLDDGSRMFLGETRERLDRDPAPPWKEPDDPEAPWGRPGSVWGKFIVSRAENGPPRHVERPASAKGWRWLEGQLQRPPWNALVRLQELGDTGRPAEGYLGLDIRPEAESPGWIRLSSSFSSGAFTVPALDYQRRWLGFLRWYAERLNPSYGQIGVEHAFGVTTLEDRLPVNFGRNSPMYTVGETRQWLRGYCWVTIVPQELVQRLGGVDAIAASGVFWQVAPLAAGGVWLQATEDYWEYDQAKAEQLFAVLAPVLRPGLPTPPDPVHRRTRPFLLVYQDAAAASSRS